MDKFFDLNFYQVLMCLVILASIIGGWFGLKTWVKMKILALETSLAALKCEVEKNKELANRSLDKHQDDNKSTFDAMRKENREDHGKIFDKLDQLQMSLIKGGKAE
jgi:hypothetical protein